MPTIKSKYNIEQFDKVLQKLAHKIAVDAVTNLNNGYANIKISGTRFTQVETGKMVSQKSEWGSWNTDVSDHMFRFYANHVSYSVNPVNEDEWGFDVAEKNYLTSNHCTKISFYATDENRKKIEKRITAFIDKLMAEASIKPVPRFKLSNMQSSQH